MASMEAENGQDETRSKARESMVSLRRRGSQMTLEIRRPGSKMLTSHRLPEIINEIGIGWYHIISFVILVCMPLAEGAGMIVMTNITHSL